ncbi:MAG TPA: hypothetical protein VN647_01810 [Nitrospira sp.]|nr:hypothetical protein [Nitrospira sp.]
MFTSVQQSKGGILDEFSRSVWQEASDVDLRIYAGKMTMVQLTVPIVPLPI